MNDMKSKPFPVMTFITGREDKVDAQCTGFKSDSLISVDNQ